jgi:hypothetical protein
MAAFNLVLQDMWQSREAQGARPQPRQAALIAEAISMRTDLLFFEQELDRNDVRYDYMRTKVVLVFVVLLVPVKPG